MGQEMRREGNAAITGIVGEGESESG